MGIIANKNKVSIVIVFFMAVSCSNQSNGLDETQDIIIECNLDSYDDQVAEIIFETARDRGFQMQLREKPITHDIYPLHIGSQQGAISVVRLNPQQINFVLAYNPFTKLSKKDADDFDNLFRQIILSSQRVCNGTEN